MARVPRNDVQRFLLSLRRTARDKAYLKWALKAREQYAALRLLQDREIRQFYVKSANTLAARVAAARAAGATNEVVRLRAMEESVQATITEMDRGLTDMFRGYLATSAEIGSSSTAGAMLAIASRADPSGLRITPTGIMGMTARVNRAAADAMWARSKDGLFLSNRIWQTSGNAAMNMREIVRESIIMGDDPVQTARTLTTYVNNGKATMAAQYPKMQERMNSTWPAGMTFLEAKEKGLLKPGRTRVPNDVCYEALRLARTESSAAANEAHIMAAQSTIGYKGMRWLISTSHPDEDICDELAEADVGLGEGVYPPGEEPHAPAHPNCLCTLQAELDDMDDIAARLAEWIDDPSSDPETELWYRAEYRGLNEEAALQGLNLSADAEKRAKQVGWIGNTPQPQPQPKLFSAQHDTPEVAKARHEIQDGTRPRKIQNGKQITHIVGTHQFLQKAVKDLNNGFVRSYLGTNPKPSSRQIYGEIIPFAQSIVDKYGGTGAIQVNTRRGTISEIIRVPGVVFGRSDSHEGYIDSDTVQIIYSSKGTHVYPVTPDRFKK